LRSHDPGILEFLGHVLKLVPLKVGPVVAVGVVTG
jgi:hypothetical protein